MARRFKCHHLENRRSDGIGHCSCPPSRGFEQLSRFQPASAERLRSTRACPRTSRGGDLIEHDVQPTLAVGILALAHGRLRGDSDDVDLQSAADAAARLPGAAYRADRPARREGGQAVLVERMKKAQVFGDYVFCKLGDMLPARSIAAYTVGRGLMLDRLWKVAFGNANEKNKLPNLGVSKEDANKCAIEDYSQSNQHLRAGLQYIFAANGGAALAMLTCLTSLSTASQINKNISIEHVLKMFGFASGFYLFGASSSVIAFFLYSFSRGNRGHFWEDNAITEIVDFDKWSAKNGYKFGMGGDLALWISVALFIVGSMLAASAFVF